MGNHDFINFSNSTLDGVVLIGDGTLDVQGGDGANFPTKDRRAVIFGAAFGSPVEDATAEIVLITDRTTDALTITRGQEGTAAKEWPDGSKIWHILTAGDLNEDVRKLVQRIYLDENSIVDLDDVIPNDDTIPQDDEGVEVFNQSFTPEKTGNRIRITVNLQVANKSGSFAAGAVFALFTDASADAIKAIEHSLSPNHVGQVSFVFEFDSPGTSPIVISLRGGTANPLAEMALNRIGSSNQRPFGAITESNMTIEEFTP